MNTKYSNWKMWYYVLCMVLTLQLAACSEETHDEYTAAPEIEDTYIDQLDALIAEMTDLQQNSDYGDKKGQYPTESRAILTDAIDDANRAVLLIKYRFFVKFGGNLFFISTVFFFLNPIKSCRYVCFLVTLKTPHH